ncbi:TetR/AcrR family transcriptional regulator [Treponema sp. Marseille-Q4130]|uniref:TetR/AcrR family transcriptional regulator n=1 Tax=Treponema sp. Marseille-Q4130 TaxID=2766702 RepID=UPI0016525015|nr:TetR/AcrR family transcriptional regulator [Treponema sp. Marseille-Q4130]MBC6719074.1 TetR/AcrR family transcriptional regulator [Treponema sp. Marseille-Q4130]
MAKKRIDRDKIIQAFLTCAFEKSAGAVSLADIASLLGVNKASLYNHFSSRDAICEAAIDFCAEYMSGVRFIPESADSLAQLSFSDALAKIVKQYFRSYEIEPLFQMYAFIHSSKFFSSEAFRAAERETQKIADDTASFIARFAAEEKLELSKNGCRLKELFGTSAKSGKQPAGVPDAENAGYANDADDIGNANEAYTLQTAASDTFKERTLFFARELSAELGAYIVEKKEMLRRNPESGAGSLFALPPDDSALAKIIARAEAYWTR